MLNSCVKNNMDLEDFGSKVLGYIIFPLQVSLEEFSYYSYDRGEDETTQGHELCLIWM